jgi:hypothetical protein
MSQIPSVYEALLPQRAQLFMTLCIALNARLEIEFRATRVYITGRAKTENGNSGLMTRAFNC